MRRTLAAVILTASLAGGPDLVRADDRSEARDILERAIKAHGGADKLARLQVSLRSGEGVLYLAGEQRFKTRVLVSLPERIRLNIEVENAQIITVINKDRGWEKRPGGVVLDMGKERLQELREEAYLWWLATLVPLRKSDFTLTPLPAAVHEGEAVVGLRAARRGHADVVLLFSKKTGLLARMSHRTTEAGLRVTKEYVYSDYKGFDGLELPTREIMNINQNKTTDIKLEDYKLLDRPEDGSFDKP